MDPPSASRRGRTPAREPDAAHIQVLEAVLIALIMLAAVGFVLTFSLPTSDTEPTRAGLSQQARDALTVLAELPPDDTRYGNDMLSYAIARALEGDDSVLVERLGQLLPTATRFNLYLSNGVDSYEIHSSGTPRGETVTASYVMEPGWTYTFVGRDSNNYAAPNTLGVYALPVHNSNVVDDGGVFVQVSANLSLGAHSWTTHAHYSTTQGVRDANGAFVSSNVYGSDAAGTPKPYWFRYDPLHDPFLNPPDSTVHVTVAEREGGTIPAGTVLVLRFPQGQRGSYDINWTEGLNVGWENVTSLRETDPNTGGTISVQLAAPLSNGELTFTFRSQFMPDVRPYDYYVLDASLSGDLHGKAEIVLQDRVSSTFTGGDYIDVYASVPKPMGKTGQTTWTVTFVNAALEPTPTNHVHLHALRLTSVDGLPLFKAVTALDLPGGSFSVEDGGRTLLWTPDDPHRGLELPTNRGIPFAIDVEANGQTTRDEAMDYLVVPVAVNQGANVYTHHLTRRVEPGLFAGQIPPHRTWTDAGGTHVALGYRTSGVDNPMVASPVHRGSLLEGAWRYDASAITVKDWLSTATVDVEERIVPVGTRASILINMENLVADLLLKGFQVETYTRIFPPWSLSEHNAVFETMSIEDAALSKDVTAILVTDLTDNGIKDVVAGTRDGKIVGFDVSKKGAAVAGMMRSFDGQSVNGIERLGTAHPPRFLVGLEPDPPKPTLYTLDSAMKSVFPPQAFSGGVVGVSSVAGGSTDFDEDGAPEYLAGDRRGASGLFDGATGTFPSLEWPKENNLRESLVEFGKTGPYAEPTAIATTGLDFNVGYWRTVQRAQSTNAGGLAAGVTEEIKRFRVSLSDDGLFGYDKSGATSWAFPAGGFRVLRAEDLNADDITDVVAGSWDGYVYAVNGEQAALPWMGMTIATGDAITGSDAVDINWGWTVDPTGFLMWTSDGWTTRNYTLDPALGAPLLFPSARSLDFIDYRKGWMVGAAGQLWRTTDSAETMTPLVHTVTPPALTLWGTANYRDVAFLDSKHGIVVGDKCSGTACAVTGTLPIYTSDGGSSWKAGAYATGHLASNRLDRVVFASPTVAYAVGLNGVYRSETASPTTQTWTCDADAPRNCRWEHSYTTSPPGATWERRSPPGITALDAVNAIACTAADTCWTVGAGGQIWKTVDGGVTWDVQASGTTKDLYAISFHPDGLVGIATGTDMTVLMTRDGGERWVRVPPAGPITGTFYTAHQMTEEVAYFFGGDAQTRAYGTTAGYVSHATAQTKTLAVASGAGRVSPSITSVRVDPYTSNNEDTAVEYHVSADGGATWSLVEPVEPDMLDLGGVLSWPWTDLPAGGQDLRLRMVLSTHLDLVMNTPVVRDIGLDYNVTFTCAGDVSTCHDPAAGVECDLGGSKKCVATLRADVDVKNGGDRDDQATDALWASVSGDGIEEIRLRPVTKLWTVNLGGLVRDIDIGPDIDGDGWREILVTVGPELQEPAVPTGNWVNAVFLLDGRSGAELARFDHTVNAAWGIGGGRQIAEPFYAKFADLGTVKKPKDGIPDVATAVLLHDYNWLTGDTRLVMHDGAVALGLDPTGDAELGSVYFEHIRPTALEIADIDGTDAEASDDFVLATSGEGGILPGFVYVYSSKNVEPGAGEWTEIARFSPDVGGTYVVHWDVPRGSPFGPYAVEVEVRWIDGSQQVQSLSFMDYFIVTPVSSRLPITPIYNVQLVAWFEDWDYPGQ